MRYLIVSDIHSNLESLHLLKTKYISLLKVDRVICLGDIVGYNADPAMCMSIVLNDLKAITIRGNHDRAIGFNDFKNFAQHSKEPGEWTREILSQAEIDDLMNLKPGPMIIDNLFAICHGSPINEDKYILSKYQTLSEFSWLRKTGINILFFGHTHSVEVYSSDKYADFNNPADIMVLNKKKIRIDNNRYYCINPGSLGQPRDGNPNACFVVFDSKKITVEYFRFRYPVEETRKKLIERGVPFGEFLGARLETGE